MFMPQETSTHNRTIWIAIAILHAIRILGLAPTWIYLFIRDGFIETCYLQTRTAQIVGVVSVLVIYSLSFLTKRARIDGERVMTASDERAEVRKHFWYYRILCVPFFGGGVYLELSEEPAARSDLMLVVWSIMLGREAVLIGLRFLRGVPKSEPVDASDSVE